MGCALEVPAGRDVVTQVPARPSEVALIEGLNPDQCAAVCHGDGPLLILAGAGSGKTRVITHRIAHLIGVRGVAPEAIMAVTFTNKAARELGERLGGLLGGTIGGAWVGTFHATCLRILRAYGQGREFAVTDASQARALVARCAQELGINNDIYPHNAVGARISSLKNDLVSADAYAADALPFGMDAAVAKVYPAYEAAKRAAGLMDFDDLLVETHRLLSTQAPVRERLEKRFRYLFVDEFQDTNHAQFAILRALCGPTSSLCVVGDDDQSIYAFRGARVGNILEFHQVYPEATVITLGRNYRSTGHILGAAQSVIAANLERRAKTLWTDNPDGELVTHHTARDEQAEAKYVVRTLRAEETAGRPWGDMAVLYRTNAQARVLEEILAGQRIPYRVVGGTRFYQRKEVRDLIAYLRLLVRDEDDEACRRVLNAPNRGIGPATRERIETFAAEGAMSVVSALQGMVAAEHLKGGALNGARAFLAVLEKGRTETGPAAMLRTVVAATGYDRGREGESTRDITQRKEILAELIGAAEAYGDDVLGFLDHQALAGDGEEKDDIERVSLMTLHAAKGLEFPVVVMTGMEEKVFPHIRAIDREEQLAEERRLCYVGMTRARERLFLVSARERTLFGDRRINPVSRFVEEIPPERMTVTMDAPPVAPAPVLRRGRQGAAVVRRSEVGQPGPNTPGGTYRAGARVNHPKWGVGLVKTTEGSGEDERVVVRFADVGEKKLSVKLAKLEVVT